MRLLLAAGGQSSLLQPLQGRQGKGKGMTMALRLSVNTLPRPRGFSLFYFTSERH